MYMYNMYSGVWLRTQKNVAQCLELTIVIIKINKIVKKIPTQRPTRNWDHPPSLFEASQNLSASRNIVFTFFQICVTVMASSQNGKMCQVSSSSEAGDAPFMDSELLNSMSKVVKNRCGKIRYSRFGSVVQTNKRFSWNRYWKSKREWIRTKTN